MLRDSVNTMGTVQKKQWDTSIIYKIGMSLGLSFKKLLLEIFVVSNYVKVAKPAFFHHIKLEFMVVMFSVYTPSWLY